MSSRSNLAAALAAVGCLLASSPAWAFKFGTSLTPACHERITWRALDGLSMPISELHEGALSEDWREPESEAELRLARYFQIAIARGEHPPEEFDGVKSGRALNSFLVGVRTPDIEGLSVKDLTDLREIHLARTGQEAHFLRAVADDWEDGSFAAAEAGRRYILQLIDASRVAHVQGPRTLQVETWVEHYGKVPVTVIASAYLLGQALHALQDSFTHTYRSESLDRIHVVQTYIDAFDPAFEEGRDGPRHSDFLDDCEHPEVAPIEAAATLASTELVRAVQRYWRTGDRSEAERVLDRWVGVRPGCAAGDPYCESPWVGIGRRKETSNLISCASVPASALSPLPFLLLATMMRRRGRRSGESDVQ